MLKNINQLIGKTSKTTNVAAIKLNEQIFTNKDDITETFNDYFPKIGTDLSSRIPPSNKGFEEFLTWSDSTVFEFKSVSNDEVVTMLSKLRDSKSSDQDKIPVKILKDSSDVRVSYLTYIFNCSLLSGIFPDDWELARVSPTYKSGDKQQCGNYRPISVLSVVVKIFEKLVCGQLNHYLKENQILTKFQSGFRESHSTISTLLSTTNSWLVNGVLFLDLKKSI